MIVLLSWAPVDSPLYGWLFEYWGRYDGFKLGQSWEAAELLRLYVLLPVVLYGPPTLLMGLSFPILQRAVQDDPRTSGRKVGVLQAANIAGCVAGSLVVGLLALGRLGTAGTMRVLIASGLVFAGLGLHRYGRTPVQLALAGGLVVTLLALPGSDQLWARLHGQASPPLHLEEDATGVVAIMPEGEGRWFLSVNGTGNSRIPFAASHTLLGSIPALVHPAPRDVAIVGLGSGNTAWAAALRPETESVTVYEISSPQPRLLKRFTAAESPSRLRRFLRDPRIEMVIADGRHALERSERLYDLIEADALRPDSAFSGNLYSLEFFKRCARKLKPGGIMCTWAPTERVRRTFQAAFPHVLSTAWGQVLIGSHEPLPLDPQAWGQRLADPRVRAYLGSAEVADMVLAQLQRAVLLPPHESVRDLNHDLFPRDEFGRPQPETRPAGAGAGARDLPP
jgi:spermidine synthase